MASEVTDFDAAALVAAIRRADEAGLIEAPPARQRSTPSARGTVQVAVPLREAPAPLRAGLLPGNEVHGDERGQERYGARVAVAGTRAASAAHLMDERKV